MKVTVDTVPPGANLFYVPLDDKTGHPLPKKGKHGQAGVPVDLYSGNYLIVAHLPDGRCHEVIRYVPTSSQGYREGHLRNHWELVDGIITLWKIHIPESVDVKAMCLLPATGEDFVLPPPTPGMPVPRFRVPAFYLDTKERTAGELRKQWLGYLAGKRHLMPPDDFPANHVSWEETIIHAERIGKRLPDEIEFIYAATACGKNHFPWGDQLPPATQWQFGPAGQPDYGQLKIPGQLVVFGLFPNLAEWTASWGGWYDPAIHLAAHPHERLIRGGPPGIITQVPNSDVQTWIVNERLTGIYGLGYPGVGFRCARSVKPRLTPEDFVTFTSMTK